MDKKAKEMKNEASKQVNIGIDKYNDLKDEDKGIIERTEDTLRAGYEKTKEFITGEPRQDETRKLEKRMDE